MKEIRHPTAASTSCFIIRINENVLYSNAEIGARARILPFLNQSETERECFFLHLSPGNRFRSKQKYITDKQVEWRNGDNSTKTTGVRLLAVSPTLHFKWIIISNGCFWLLQTCLYCNFDLILHLFFCTRKIT